MGGSLNEAEEEARGEGDASDPRLPREGRLCMQARNTGLTYLYMKGLETYGEDDVSRPLCRENRPPTSVSSAMSEASTRKGRG